MTANCHIVILHSCSGIFFFMRLSPCMWLLQPTSYVLLCVCSGICKVRRKKCTFSGSPISMYHVAFCHLCYAATVTILANDNANGIIDFVPDSQMATLREPVPGNSTGSCKLLDHLTATSIALPLVIMAGVVYFHNCPWCAKGISDVVYSCQHFCVVISVCLQELVYC